MKLTPLKTCLPLAVLLTAGTAFAQSNGVPGAEDYTRFANFIADRNIFDPSRQPHSPTSHYHHTTHITPRGTPGIQFVGTMSYEKGNFAFFSGTSSDLSEVLQAGNQIVGYTVKEISPTSVVLESTNSQTFSLNVGDGLRQEGSKWVRSDAAELPVSGASTTSSTSGSSSTSTPAGPPPSAGEPNDILKRLMQQREKENQ